MTTYQELANLYFREYKTTGDFNKDLQRWNEVKEIISTMPLIERAKYADFVTKNICENHPEIGLEYTRKEVIPMLSRVNLNKANTCAIANIAAHIMLLPENERQQYEIL